MVDQRRVFFISCFRSSASALVRVRRLVDSDVADLFELTIFAAAIFVFFRYGETFLRNDCPVPDGQRHAVAQLLRAIPAPVGQFLAGCSDSDGPILSSCWKPVGSGEDRVVAIMFWLSVVGLGDAAGFALPISRGLPQYYLTIELAVHLGEVAFFSTIILARKPIRAGKVSGMAGNDCRRRVQLLGLFASSVPDAYRDDWDIGHRNGSSRISVSALPLRPLSQRPLPG